SFILVVALIRNIDRSHGLPPFAHPMYLAVYLKERCERNERQPMRTMQRASYRDRSLRRATEGLPKLQSLAGCNRGMVSSSRPAHAFQKANPPPPEGVPGKSVSSG